jgi:hypothetical protein
MCVLMGYPYGRFPEGALEAGGRPLAHLRPPSTRATTHVALPFASVMRAQPITITRPRAARAGRS